MFTHNIFKWTGANCSDEVIRISLLNYAQYDFPRFIRPGFNRLLQTFPSPPIPLIG